MKPGLFSFAQTPGVLPPGSVSNAELADMAARTVKVNATNVSASPQDLQGSTALSYLRVNAAGNGLEFGALPVDPGAVTSVFGRTGAVVSANGDYTASQVTNVPAGGIAAITVQAAINELDTEKYTPAANTLPIADLVNAAAQYDIIGRKTAGGGAWEDCTYAQLLLARTDVANVFTALQTVNLNASTPPTPTANTGFYVAGVTGSANRIQMRSAAAANALNAYRYNTSFAAPSAIASGDQLFSVSAGGYNGTSEISAVAGVQIIANQNWGVNVTGARLQFTVTPDTDPSVGQLAMVIAADRGMYMQGATSSSLGSQTFNASALYANGNLVADGNGLARLRQYTVATLPAATGAAPMPTASVSDALATIITGLGLAPVGGGANKVPVFDDGAWKIG